MLRNYIFYSKPPAYGPKADKTNTDICPEPALTSALPWDSLPVGFIGHGATTLSLSKDQENRLSKGKVQFNVTDVQMLSGIISQTNGDGPIGVNHDDWKRPIKTGSKFIRKA